MQYFAGIIISLFLAFILFSKKNKSEADKILALWLLFTGFHLAFFYLFIDEKYVEFPYLLGFELPLPFIHGPFLFLYCTSLTGQNYKPHLRWLHFLPFLLFYLPFISFFFLSNDEKILVYQNKGEGYGAILWIRTILYILSGVVYVVLSLRVLERHKKTIVEQFSYTEKINLAWLRYLIWGMAVIWLAVILGNDVYVFTAVVVFIIFIGYYGIKQVGIFTHKEENSAVNFSIDDGVQPKPVSSAKNDFDKYSKSGLDEEAVHTIHRQLVEGMKENKWYKNPELSLGKLAQYLAVQSNQLSQVINTIEQKNFYDYVNGLRVEEFMAEAVLPANQKFTLLALAYECGFNSKASFNRNFKKVVGLSPSDYLKSIDITLSEN